MICKKEMLKSPTEAGILHKPSLQSDIRRRLFKTAVKKSYSNVVNTLNERLGLKTHIIEAGSRRKIAKD